MLPTLSRLSVSHRPGSRLRHGCSSRSLRISPLHLEFRFPLQDSSFAVSDAVPRLKRGISHPTYKPPTRPLRPVIPNNACTLCLTAAAGTELAGASFAGTVKISGYWPLTHSSLLTGLYNPKAFIAHAASLRQGFPHCAIFPTTASRRSLGRVSVPVWLIILSDQLPVLALVGRYPTNKLMGRGPILRREAPKGPPLFLCNL